MLPTKVKMKRRTEQAIANTRAKIESISNETEKKIADVIAWSIVLILILLAGI